MSGSFQALSGKVVHQCRVASSTQSPPSQSPRSVAQSLPLSSTELTSLLVPLLPPSYSSSALPLLRPPFSFAAHSWGTKSSRAREALTSRHVKPFPGKVQHLTVWKPHTQYSTLHTTQYCSSCIVLRDQSSRTHGTGHLLLVVLVDKSIRPCNTHYMK